MDLPLLGVVAAGSPIEAIEIQERISVPTEMVRRVSETFVLEVRGNSMIEEQKVDWIAGAAQITPATELHSHHNRGSRRMVSLVVQDEGLHFYTRTPGFSWD